MANKKGLFRLTRDVDPDNPRASRRPVMSEETKAERKREREIRKYGTLTEIAALKKSKSSTTVSKSGRKKGTLDRKSMVMERMCAETGELPHEFLLRVMRGEIEVTIPIEEQLLDEEGRPTGERIIRWVKEVPDLAMRVDAAKAAAPYYAPKLAAMNIDINQQNNVTLTSITLIKKSPENHVQPKLIEGTTVEDNVVNGHFINKLAIKSIENSILEFQSTADPEDG